MRLPGLPGTHIDLILCRNVMIYFAPEGARRLIGKIHEVLEEGGWLLVGGAESNLQNYQAFRTVNAPGARLFHYRHSDAAHGRLRTGGGFESR